MERLTERNADGSVKYAKGCYSGCEYLTCSMEEGYQCNHQCEADIVCKLADYEDAEEQGLILRLPFKIGQKVYYIYESYVGALMVGSMVYGYSCLDFPRAYFATKEEAEQALKQMGE